MNHIGRRKFLTGLSVAGLGTAISAGMPVDLSAKHLMHTAAPKNTLTRIGIVGLDTSQVTMIISHINNIAGPGYDVVQPEWDERFEGFRVVAAYPYGSRKIESSAKQIPFYVGKMKENGVEVVDSLNDLLKKVDVVMIMTFDGHLRLEQTMQVLRAGKRVFINKPFAASLTDVVKIINASKKMGVPFFSSSPTRYLKGIQAARGGSVGEILGASTYSKAPLEPTHPDFYWYGIHGIEILFAIMGKDCITVQRTHNTDTDIVVGTWKDNRLGTYRGIRKGFGTHSGIVFGSESIIPAGSFNDVGHRPLVLDMLNFFATGVSPVSVDEMLAIHVFMEAADESKRLGGAPVLLQSVLEKAMKA